MMASKLDGLSQIQRERLFYLEFRAFFLGAVNRYDIVNRFGVKDAAGTRDIRLYRDLAPGNIQYEYRVRSYQPTEHFKPLFSFDVSQAMVAIAHGMGDDFIGTGRPLIACDLPTHLNTPEIDVLAAMTRAIHLRRAVRLTYRSLSNGATRKEIVPYALVDNGLRWHVRGYDRKRKRFSDFVINRMSGPKLMDEEKFPEHETREADIQWNRIVTMEIAPHPKLKHPETISHEYAMKDGVLTVNVRAAVAGYVLRRWNVDCSEDHHLEGAEIHLWLRNRPTLYGVEGLVIAPGFSGDFSKDCSVDEVSL
ncbi:MAG: WYL domain-containing protein [Magnetococcales bacterium]|nr:WYL domain-containing protein [Magnetococcales bacterium]